MKTQAVNSMAISVVNVAPTDSKYDINTCIGTKLFHLTLDLDTKYTMMHIGNPGILSPKIFHVANDIDILKSLYTKAILNYNVYITIVVARPF